MVLHVGLLVEVAGYICLGFGEYRPQRPESQTTSL